MWACLETGSCRTLARFPSSHLEWDVSFLLPSHDWPQVLKGKVVRLHVCCGFNSSSSLSAICAFEIGLLWLCISFWVWEYLLDNMKICTQCKAEMALYNSLSLSVLHGSSIPLVSLLKHWELCLTPNFWIWFDLYTIVKHFQQCTSANANDHIMKKKSSSFSLYSETPSR